MSGFQKHWEDEMAKVKFFDALGDYGTVSFDTDNLEVTKETKAKVIYSDPNLGLQVVFEGSQLTTDKNDTLSSGHIDGITFQTTQGDKLITIKHMDWDAQELYDYAVQYGSATMLSYVFLHNDQFTGSIHNDIIATGYGDDRIDGGLGNDNIMAGGGDDKIDVSKGNDIISFGRGDGADVVTGFDAGGGAGHQDLIELFLGDKYHVRKSGQHDTIIDLDNGDELKVLGVAPGEINGSDFHHV
jgi:hypothetical protein